MKIIFSSALEWPFDSLESEYCILYIIIRHHQVFRYQNSPKNKMHIRNPLTSRDYTNQKSTLLANDYLMKNSWFFF